MLRRLFVCVLVLLANSGGCPCDPGLLIHLSEDWEGCEDICEWTISGGGSARIVETFHSAEHALLLDHATATRDLSVEVPEVDTLDLALATDCRPALLEVRLEWAGGRTQQVTPVNCELLKPPGGDRPYHTFCGDAHTARPAGATALRAIKITSLATCTVDRLLLFSKGDGC